jgi:hypothetical protein
VPYEIGADVDSPEYIIGFSLGVATDKNKIVYYGVASRFPCLLTPIERCVVQEKCVRSYSINAPHDITKT